MPPAAARLLLAACLALLPIRAAIAADGVPVMPLFHGPQERPGLAPDGAGGAWVAFKVGTDSIGLAHLDGRGLAIANGSQAVHAVSLQMDLTVPSVVVSGATDRVFVVADLPGSTPMLAGWDDDGAPLPGIPLLTSGYLRFPGALRTPDGRVLVAGSVLAGGGQWGTRFGFTGPDGVLAQEGTFLAGYQLIEGPREIVADGSGGGIMTLPIYFAFDYTTGSDIAVQRVAANGGHPWGTSGKRVCTVSGDQLDCHLAADGAGGVFVTWTDGRTSPAAAPYDIYAARLDSSGTLVAGWGTLYVGKRVTTSTGAQTDSRVVTDGAGGVWVLWRDQRVPDVDLYFTHLLGNGSYAAGWTGAGALLCGATGDATYPQMVPDGAGGFFAAWVDLRNGNTDVFAQHVTATGAVAAGWPANGLALCDDPSFQTQLQMVATAPGAALVAWHDSRGTAGEVRAIALGDAGPVTTGVPALPGVAFALRAAANPVVGAPAVRLSAPGGGRVALELLDAAGRVVDRAAATGSGGPALVRFGGGPLPAGLYFVRATLGARSLSTRVCVLR